MGMNKTGKRFLNARAKPGESEDLMGKSSRGSYEFTRRLRSDSMIGVFDDFFEEEYK